MALDEPRAPVPGAAATDFTTGLAHWVGQAAHAPEPPRPRVKLPSSKHAHLSANFLWQNKDEALCTVERRSEAGNRIVKAKRSQADALDLENLCLTGLPAQVGDLAGLVDLNLNFNRLRSLPDQIGQLGGLKILRIGGVNELQSVPECIFKLENLVQLDLSGNKLRRVSKKVGELVHLTHLYLDSNHLERLPKNLDRLGELQVFSASMNPFISVVPPEMGQMMQLKRLDLSNTQIATLPPQWNEVIENSIVSLNLSYTNFYGFHGKLKMPKRMKLLDLRKTHVVTLPADFGPLDFYGNSDGNVLRTTNRRGWDKNLKIMVEDTNLPASLNQEGRMATKQPIPQLRPLRHEDKRFLYVNQDNDVGSDDDDGEDIDFHMAQLMNTGPMQREHAERVRAAAVNRLPTGRAADFAAELANAEFADRWGVEAPQPLNPWGNAVVPPWPSAEQPLAIPLPVLASGPQVGRWANQRRNPGNPAFEGPLEGPVLPGAGWGVPYGPQSGFFTAPQTGPFPVAVPPQLGMGWQSAAPQYPQATGIGPFNNAAPFMPPGAMGAAMPSAAMAGAAAPLQQGVPPSRAVQPPDAAPEQAAAARPQGFYLSPGITPGGRVAPPSWAPPTKWRDTLADYVDMASELLRGGRRS